MICIYDCIHIPVLHTFAEIHNCLLCCFCILAAAFASVLLAELHKCEDAATDQYYRQNDQSDDQSGFLFLWWLIPTGWLLWHAVSRLHARLHSLPRHSITRLWSLAWCTITRLHSLPRHTIARLWGLSRHSCLHIRLWHSIAI